MASIASEESSDSDILVSRNIFKSNRFFINIEEPLGHDNNKSNINIINKLSNRQMYGRIARHPRANTERTFNHVYYRCRVRLEQIIPKHDVMGHIFMGFTLCGQFFISYTTRSGEPVSNIGNLFPSVEYDLYIWKFVHGQKLQYISTHRIFKLFKSSLGLDEITFMQCPQDPSKIICYALAPGNSTMTFFTIITLPSKNCSSCKSSTLLQTEDKLASGWCLKHGFVIHFMFTMSQPAPMFNPHVSLAFPDHLVINTGHCIHILNISTVDPVRTVIPFHQDKYYDNKMITHTPCNCTDNLSEISESPSELFGNTNVVDAILEDFSDYDLEGNDYNKPFHELNISCEPLNVIGKTYHNALVQNIVDTRLKHLQTTNKDCIFSMPQSSGLQKQMEKSKIDKKIAEKAYEFIEENEKCEKLSLFRKKRLADKKYEFSEDNSENIVPFYSLRREKRCFHRVSSYCIRSPEFSNSLFLSPRSPSIRSPMQSPNSRNGQFSPGGARHIYCPIMRNHSHYSKCPISPKDATRTFHVYSPGLDSDCSDSDSRLILRQVHNISTSHINDHKTQQHADLLIIDGKHDEAPPKWIKKVVKRYSSIDFENSSLLSGQSRDDNNIPIEIPVLVQTLNEQQLDNVPEIKCDQVYETQLIVTQRTFDCDQFVQSRAQKLCSDAQLEFLHCEDYDIQILQICPLNGHIICKAKIRIGALQDLEPSGKRNSFMAECLFTWNIPLNTFEVIEPPLKYKLQTQWYSSAIPCPKIPIIAHKKVLVMNHIYPQSKKFLRDYNNYYEICMDDEYYEGSGSSDGEFYDEYSIPTDSD